MKISELGRTKQKCHDLQTRIFIRAAMNRGDVDEN